MRRLLKHLGLLLLLIVAQQGAVVHELNHVSGAGSADLKLTSGAADTTCALCPAFAQANTPAFSYSVLAPSLARAAHTASAEPLYALIDTAVPRPRSRGPPVSS